MGAGYFAKYMSQAKLRPESAWSEYNTRGGKVMPDVDCGIGAGNSRKMFRKYGQQVDEETAGKQILGTVPIPCEWDKIEVIRTVPAVPEDLEEQERRRNLELAEAEWNKLQALPPLMVFEIAGLAVDALDGVVQPCCH